MRPHPSPNHNSRGASEIEVIVLHSDASPTERGTISWLQSSASKVSYHVLVGRDGTAYQFVPYDRRAWHSGKSSWNGKKDVNSISIGLSFSNRNNGIEPITEAQKATMQAIIADIRARYGPLPVTTHARVAPGRKSDPEFFAMADGTKRPVPGFQLEDYA